MSRSSGLILKILITTGSRSGLAFICVTPFESEVKGKPGSGLLGQASPGSKLAAAVGRPGTPSPRGDAPKGRDSLHAAPHVCVNAAIHTLISDFKCTTGTNVV